MKQHIISCFIATLIFITLITTTLSATAPFIPFNDIHPVQSEFQFNLILNENRNTPIVMVQYCKDNTIDIIEDIVQDALKLEKDISFALTIDCRKFSYDLNKSLGICRGFQNYKEVPVDQFQQVDNSKINDPFFKIDFFSPNPTRIKEKGHLLSRNHDIQNLRDLNANFNGQFLAKVIRNQVPDFITYIEDQSDLDQFLGTNSEFRSAKGPKIIYFDQNLQSPLFIKKLAVNLDGWMQVAVSDSNKMAMSFNAKYEDVLLIQYDFETNKYDIQKINYDHENSLETILKSKAIRMYTSIKKSRDILLDFQHKSSTLYNLTNLKQVNQLIAHGRIILLQISSNQKSYDCSALIQKQKQYGVIFNYVCFNFANAHIFLTAVQADPQNGWMEKLYFIDGSLKKAKTLSNINVNLYEQLPKNPARQQITTVTEGQLCVKAAKAADKEPIFFYFNQKSHSTSLHVLKYFSSLPEVTSLLYFCQFYLPDEEVTRNYQLNQNTIFSIGQEDRHGQVQKIQHKKMQDYLSIKMFLREVSITKVMNFYEQKIIRNQIIEIKTAQELTQKCFSSKCIIALIETDKFHQQSELAILKELQISFSEQGFKFYWIDGICHYEIGKQLKIVEKGSKLIDRSYLFYFSEKNNDFALWKGGKINKFWDKKQVFKWVKSLRNSQNINRIKFGIDIETKKCLKAEQPVPKQPATNQGIKQATKTTPQARNQVNSDEL